MSTIVGVMDEDDWRARTDNLVRIDPATYELMWIPRDLWCDGLRDRINLAYASGGAGTLLEALSEHGFRTDYVICVRRGATESFLRSVSVTVPVDERVEYWYPKHPGRPLEEAKRRIVFEPPEERLHGIRLHEWMGARKPVHGGGSDLHRIARQQVLVRRLLEDGTDFSPILEDPDRIMVSDPRALTEMARVDATWQFSVFDDVAARTIDGKMVLVSRLAGTPAGE